MKKIYGKISYDVLYTYFLGVSVNIDLGKNVMDAMFGKLETLRNKKLKAVLTAIRNDMYDNGTPFSDAIRVYEKNLPVEIVSLLCVGEATGTMKAAVKNCETLMRTLSEMKRTVKNVLQYPKFLLFISLIATALVYFFVFPSLNSLFPGASLGTSRTVVLSVLVLLVILTTVYIILSVLCKMSSKVKTFIDFILLNLPVIGVAEKSRITAICAPCLDSMLDNGMSGTQIYEMLIRIIPNNYVKSNIKAAYDDLRDGVQIDVCLQYTEGFSDSFYSIPLVSNKVYKGKSPLQICGEHDEAVMMNIFNKLVSYIQPIFMLAIGAFLIYLFSTYMTMYMEIIEQYLLL
ncbi:MAG: type II secretion system F family protein [Clostridia bacterium]|nr:type II secretion system F family protein [Clostridia bacterium]